MKRSIISFIMILNACSNNEIKENLDGSWSALKESSCAYSLTLGIDNTYEITNSCTLNQVSAEVETDRGTYESLEDGSLLFLPKEGSCSGLLKKKDAKLPFVLNYRFVLKDQLLVEYPTKIYILKQTNSKPYSEPVNIGCFQNDFFVQSPVEPY